MNKDQPLVSIMMPCRNAAKFLSATIHSLQAQTYTNWVLIFVDDGSTDNTLEIVNQFANVDTRIKVFPISHGGRGVARNKCVEYFNGEFVAVCDADDISFPDRFAKQVDFLTRNPDIGAVGSWWIPFDTDMPETNKPVRRFPTAQADLRSSFAKGKMRFHNATVMLRADLFVKFGAYNVELRRAQDYEFFSRLSRAGVNFAALPEPLVYYRQDDVVPHLSYFKENGMYMAYADKLLSGYRDPFDYFFNSANGYFWRVFYTLKYVYFYLKMRFLKLLGA